MGRPSCKFKISNLKQMRVMKEGNFPTLCTERIKVQQVLQNLISNGIKYNDKTYGLVSISSYENGRYVRFDITDNGMGIGKEYHEKIFGLFNKLEAQSNGTGIGLALVKRIIEVHGGRIWIESQPGLGTTFYFTIPQ